MDQKKVVGFLAYWVVNAVVLLVAAAIFSGNVVLGNKDISAPLAAVLVAVVITVLTYLVEPVVAKSGMRQNLKSLTIKDEYSNGLIYLGANVVIVWVVKWFASTLGLGVANIFYVVLVGILLTLGQWAVFKLVPTGVTSKK